MTGWFLPSLRSGPFLIAMRPGDKEGDVYGFLLVVVGGREWEDGEREGGSDWPGDAAE